jgi:hypothetical protein
MSIRDAAGHRIEKRDIEVDVQVRHGAVAATIRRRGRAA